MQFDCDVCEITLEAVLVSYAQRVVCPRCRTIYETECDYFGDGEGGYGDLTIFRAEKADDQSPDADDVMGIEL